MKTATLDISMVSREGHGRMAFNALCLWSVVLLCRPQDYLVVLEPLRPNLLLTVLTVLAFLHTMQKLQGPAILAQKQLKYYLTFYLVMILSIPTSLYARLSFTTVVTEYSVCVIYCLIFYKLVDDLDKLSRVLLLGCLGSGLYFVVSLATGLAIEGRLNFGNMFDPNDLAYFTLTFLPLNLLFIGRNQPPWIRLATMFAVGAGVVLIMLSGSRGGLLGFVVALLVFLLFTSGVKTAVKVPVLLLGFVLLVNAPINYDRFSSILDLQSDYNTYAEEGRLSIWGIGLRTMITHPLTGVGVGNSSYAVGLDRQNRGLDRARWQAVHNSAIQIGAETGVAGLVLYLLLCLWVLRSFVRVKARSRNRQLVKVAEMAMVGFAGMLTAAMFLSQGYSVYLVFYVALSAVVSRFLAREQTDAGGTTHG